VERLMADLTPDDLMRAVDTCREALVGAQGDYWERPAGGLTWTCRQTLDHIADGLLWYAGLLATRATSLRPPLRAGDPDRSVAELLVVVEAAATILAEVAKAASPGARAFHPWGRADVSGVVGMACVEMLVHTGDIMVGLGRGFRAPEDLAVRVLARMFPWE